MNLSFRKTTQLLAPATHSSHNGVFNIYPAYPIGTDQIQLGFDALARQIAAHPRAIIDGMGGVMWEDFRRRLSASLGALGSSPEWLDVSQALLPESDLNRLIEPFLGGDDPLFGTRNTARLQSFFVAEKLRELGQRFLSAERTILYGTGAALAGSQGFVVYVDVPKNEIQFRSRARSVTNLGARSPDSPKRMYKRFYFVDWPPLRTHQAKLLPRLDLIVDSQRPDEPTLMSGETLRRGLAKMARSLFRVRPWFEPGPWGGQWMKKHFPGLAPESPNLAWSFELISPENGLVFESDNRLLEVSFDFLMCQEQQAVLGRFAERFGAEFPIRFDYLDTFDGGNLSLQCHPRPEYARRHFSERFTQDETYYITDCTPDAGVFLGFKDGVQPHELQHALEKSFHEASPFDVDRFVQKHPARKHQLYLIPHGTVHCSGKNNLVLEISATPYIFTFKMYDWMRLDLDGGPRPLNIQRAMDNLNFEMQGERAQRELISQPRSLARGPGWELIHLPTHNTHFYDVHRFDFTGSVEARTEGSPHVLNVTEGESVVVETPDSPPFHCAFAETFVIPAATERYRLTSANGGPLKVVKAFLKPGATHS
jgi:mannose-6-phosphate isomerase class I